MRTKVKNFIGIDVSKLTLDVSVIQTIDGEWEDVKWMRMANTKEGLEELQAELIKLDVTFDEQSLVVIENTGIYHRKLANFCKKIELPLVIENAARIKWSLGLVRGKSDKADSKRIAVYALRHNDEMLSGSYSCDLLYQLSDLLSTRDMLIKQINQLKVPMKERALFGDQSVGIQMAEALEPAIAGLEKSKKQIEQQILSLIKENEKLNSNFKLAISVPGIGWVTAAKLMVYTRNFTAYVTGKQLASYCGCAPFENTSGTSIKGKPHVHQMSNKDLKRLLHQGARSIIKHNAEFQNYYQRKVAEGKHDLSIVNAVKNKIILRVAAVVKNRKKYVDNCEKAA